MFPELDSITFEASPFEHFTGHCETPAPSMEWLDWLERGSPVGADDGRIL